MKTLNNFLETTEYRWIRTQYVDVEDGKYVNAIKHIVEHKPKFIVEYGGGQSTLMITELVNYLDYGGKVIGYENDESFYNQHIEMGWNKHNNIKLVDVVQFAKGNLSYVRYNHPMEDIKGVDFVIIDGPNLEEFEPFPYSTTNLEDIVEHLGYEIFYFIDGRLGTKRYYDELGYTKNIGDKKNEINS